MLSDKLDELLKIQYEKGKYDCYWLVKTVAREEGMELPDFDGAEDNTIIKQILDERNDLCEEIDKPEPFCAVLFSFIHPYITHMGFVLEDGKRFIHLYKKRNVAIERLDHPLWSKKIKGYYRWKKNI